MKIKELREAIGDILEDFDLDRASEPVFISRKAFPVAINKLLKLFTKTMGEERKMIIGNKEIKIDKIGTAIQIVKGKILVLNKE